MTDSPKRRWMPGGPRSRPLAGGALRLALVLCVWGWLALPARSLGGTPRASRAPRSAVAFSPDGTLLAVGGYGEVSLLDAGTGRSRGVLMAALASVTGVAFDPGGRRLAASGGNPGQSGAIQLWDLATRRSRLLSGLHTDTVYSLAWSADGTLLAACSYDRFVSVWNAATGLGRKLKDHTDAVYSVAFSPDGRRLASASGDRTVKVWDVTSGKRLYTLGDSTAELYSVAFSPSGTQLAAGGVDRSLRVWTVAPTAGSLARAAFAHDGAVIRVLYSPDGSEIYTSSEDRTVKRWDAATLVEKGVFEKQPDWPVGLALDREGKRLAVSRYDGSAVVYDAHLGWRKLDLPRGR